MIKQWIGIIMGGFSMLTRAPAINFHLHFGFEFVGFDAAAYSNEDVEKKEVRFVLALKL